MKFATNPTDPSSFVLAAQGFITAQPSRGVWLLVDAALLDPQRLTSVLRRNAWASANALANTPLAAYGARGPQLVELPKDIDALTQGLGRFAEIGLGAPAFSCLSTNQPLEQLQTCLGYLAQVVHDGLKLHCRMSDTRVLPALLTTLSEPQARRVSQTIAQWQWLNREGSIGSWHAIAGQSAIDSNGHLELNTTQFASLLDAAEADGIFAQLLETVSQLVPRTDRARFHQRLQRILSVATNLSVAGNPDRLQFAVLALTCGEDFYQHPELSKTWQAVKQGTSLSTLMKNWSDALWNALEGRKT